MADGHDAHPQPSDMPALFGRVRVDGNPLSLVTLDGAALPKPKQVVFADDFRAAQLDKGWSIHISPAHAKQASIAPEDGMLCFMGQHYKFAYLSRPLGEDNISVQARVRVSRTGCELGWHPGLTLYWGKGRYGFITAGGFKGGDERLVIRGCGAKHIPLGHRLMMVLDGNQYDFWVKITLSPDRIRYSSSLDGKVWDTEADVPRPKDYAGAPALLILGAGWEGAGEVFQNDAPHETGLKKASIGELVVGRD
jgi:hypothetical protein